MESLVHPHTYPQQARYFYIMTSYVQFIYVQYQIGMFNHHSNVCVCVCVC